MKRKLELLAPAKDAECGMAAIDCGADAVYIGAERFGARQAAGNSIEQIESLCRYAHTFGCKVYVTVNTIIYDNEIDDTQALITELGRIGADAILVQDMGITKLNIPENLSLHASTQTDNRTPEKIEWLSQNNFSRVVLARELSLEEIRSIHERVPDTELEAFVHGALCVSYSGVCYASEYCFGRSANRGACAQFCRMKFDLIDGADNVVMPGGHLLSLKDMCRINSLEQMADAGVTSFKIEGRLKDINYVRNITAAYSQKLNEIISRRSDEYERASVGRCDIHFHPNLKKTFNRGFTSYFLNGRTGDLASFYTPKAIGEYVGKVKEIRGNSFNVAGTATFSNGDGVCFINSDNELEGFRINRAEGNRLFPLKMPQGLKRGTALYRNSDTAFEKEISNDKTRRKIGIDISLKETDNGISIKAEIPKRSICYETQRDMAKEKAKCPQTENIRRQLSKLGNTVFYAHDIDIIPADFTSFVPNSLLTELRREVTDNLMAKLCMHHHNETRRQASAQATDESFGKIPKYPQTYMYNISNELARVFYEENGLAGIKPAFEIKKPYAPLIMQCRYCLRHELGICRKSKEADREIKEPLRLKLADGRTFKLEFDCKNCQMNIYAEK